MISCSSHNLENVVPPIACIRVDITRAEAILSHLEATSSHSQSLNLRQAVQIDHPADRILRVARIEDIFGRPGANLIFSALHLHNLHLNSIYLHLSTALLEKFLDLILLFLYFLAQSGLLIPSKLEVVVVGLVVLPLEPHECFDSLRSPESVVGSASRRLLDHHVTLFEDFAKLPKGAVRVAEHRECHV